MNFFIHMRNIIDEIYEYKEIKKRKRPEELLTVL